MSEASSAAKLDCEGDGELRDALSIDRERTEDSMRPSFALALFALALAP